MSMMRTIHQFDETAFKWCVNNSYAKELASASRWISRTGDGPFYAILGLTLVLLEIQYGMNLVESALMAFAIELPVYLLVKNSIKRNRPHDAIQGFKAFLKPSDKFSFPSGHTAGAFLMATLISHYYPDFAPFAFLMAVLIGCSRVLLGVHFPTDILAGMILGVSTAMISLNILGI